MCHDFIFSCGWRNALCVCITYSLSADKHLCCFYILTIRNSNNKYGFENVSMAHPPRILHVCKNGKNGKAGPWAVLLEVFVCLPVYLFNKLHTDFSDGWPSLHFHQWLIKINLCSYSHYNLCLFFLKIAILTGLNLHFPHDKDIAYSPFSLPLRIMYSNGCIWIFVI